MSELRHDPLTNNWVIIAPERLNRPGATPIHDLLLQEEQRAGCPFCLGNETMTPPAILSQQTAENTHQGSWSCRVVPNRFPALQVEPQLKKSGNGLYDWISGVGAHEVLIETPQHIQDASALSAQDWFNSFQALQSRIGDLKRDFRLLSLLYLKNQGSSAGATIAHSHAQILALPIIAPQLDTRLQNGVKYERFHGRCGYCDRLAQEIGDETRVISKTNRLITFAPYASQFPFQTIFQPLEHSPCFELTPIETLFELSEALSNVLSTMKRVLGQTALQWILYTAPMQSRNWDPLFDWHLELRPVLYPIGGVEWGSGLTINPVAPEEAAEKLRH